MSTVPGQAYWRQNIALLPVYMNVFMMGCGNGWLPNAIYFMMIGQEVHATSTQCAMIASFSELGRIIFAIPAGILADKYGRKKITIAIGFLHFFIWLGVSLDTSLITIYAGRLIVGVATALVNATALTSIGEIASPEIRGQLTSIYQIFMNVGAILTGVISALFSSYKLLSWGIAFFSTVSLLPMLWVSETPSFLVTVSKLEQAKTNLQRIRKGYSEREIDEEFDKLKKYIEDERIRKSQVSWAKFLKSKAIRKPLFSGTLLNFFSMFTGGALIATYITAIYPSNDYVPKKYYPLIIQILYFFMAFGTVFYIDKFPRRSIFMIGAAAMAIINAFCSFISFFDFENQPEQVFKWIFIVSNLLLVLCFGASVQPINSAIKSELYPQAVKGFCGSLGVISQALALIVMYQLYNFIKAHSHLYLMYIILSFNSIVLYLVIYYLLPEGRGTFLTDLQEKFKEELKSSNISNVEKNSQN